MVTKINLLPPEIRDKDRADRLIVYMFIAFIVFVFAMVGVKFLRDYQIAEAQAGLESVRAEAIGINKSIGQLTAYEEREKELVRLEGILNTAMDDAVIWSRILNDVSIITPNDIVLKEMNCDQNSITMRADAFIFGDERLVGHKPVAKWLINLSKSGTFKYVWLTQSAKKDGENVLNVDAKVSFKGPQEKAPAKKVPPVNKGK